MLNISGMLILKMMFVSGLVQLEPSQAKYGIDVMKMMH